jgi:hypothetical protein
MSTIFTQALDTDGGALNGLTLVQRIAAAAMTLPAGTITQMRFSFQAGNAEGLVITNAYVQHRAGAGDAYDFSTTPIQILFGGSGTKTIAATTTEVSDWVTFAYDKTTDLLISFYSGGGTTNDTMRYKTGLNTTNFSDYFKTANDAATVNKTGYTANAGFCVIVNKIESFDPSGFFLMF